MSPNAATAPHGLEHIKRVVVLMFENRSFDHIFGALPGVNGLLRDGQINQNYYNLPNPHQPASPTNLPVYPAPVDPSLPMQRDFTHDFGDGMMPDLFGPTFKVQPEGAPPSDWSATYWSGFVNGAPKHQVAPTQTHPSTNSGFFTTYQGCEPQGQAALSYFEDGVLRVLHTLARTFVVCDNWYCDMPGHTEPNRCFIHCAQTGNVGIDDTDSGQNTAPTIFDLIDQLPEGVQPRGWKMYAPVGNNGLPYHLDTAFLNSKAQSHGGSPITEFAADCCAGTLPFYSFIMCWLPNATAWTDTSMHPNSLVQPGENLLAAVYNTLRQSRCWDDTLLVVTFDENGGIYDHMFPPPTNPPDPARPVVTQTVPGSANVCGNRWTLQSDFDFSLLGLRIPALLISPWLAAGVDSHQYQNTSVVRFLVDRLNAMSGHSRARVTPLTDRDANAPPLDSAFEQFGRHSMRQDCPVRITPYPTLPSTDPSTGSNAIPYSDGTLMGWTAPASTPAAPPVTYIRELLNMYVAPLPGSPESGRKITRTFATNAEVASYTEQRLQAAQRFHAAHSQHTGT